ncbi:MAG TPA: OFA family MFS transporter [Steroidobacteraceae bacterium]|nr:OFA family MFS transporter [Steroidobacteraceae bacterium]
MLLIGTVYSWAIFTQPFIVSFGWDLTTTTWAYATANFCLATVGVVVGGFWLDKKGPRQVAMTGVALWGGGNVLAGLGTPSFGASWLYLTYGLVGGVGAGMAYITPLAVVSKWFPERRGLAGGLVVGSFGLGAFVYNQAIPRLAAFHALSVQAAQILSAGAAGPRTSAVALHLATGEAARTIMQIFIVSGLAFLAIGLPAASVLRNPPPQHDDRPGSRHSSVGYPPTRVIRMPQFYLLWLQLFANVIAGITIISNAVVILSDLTSLASASIAPLFGVVSIFNAVGRFFWGGISDHIGCQRTFAAMFAVQAVTLCWLCAVHTPAPALAGFAIVLLCCGGGFGTMPSYSAQCFGTRYMGLNYGLVLTAWGAAGLLGPMLVARAKDAGLSFSGLMPGIACVLVACIVLPMLTRRPALTVRSAPAV